MKRKWLMYGLTVSICSMMWLTPATAQTASDFKLKASTAESSNSQFTITLSGEQIEDLYAYEAKLTFDPEKLELVKAETDIEGYSVSAIVTNGEITFAHTKIGKVKGEKGNLDITTLTFKAKKAGSSQVKWTGMKIVDQNLKSQTISPNLATSFMKLFSDISGHWAKADIMAMVDRGVVSGMSTDRFAPNNEVTRAQFAMMLAGALKLKAGSGNPFKDVKKGAWYEDAVKKAYAAGLVSGVTADSFKPEKPISREEMAVMLVRSKAYALGVKPETLKEGKLPSYSDQSSISGWAKFSVSVAAEAKLMNGRSAALFAPKGQTTRAEAAVVLKRLLASL
ncbi:S-layer homology domain-containing protein [Paenibacillus sp. LHD-117]|uniref:S-layer homology domain-containing protein n=1 Tax=Paenibacillus sp. LHD-117 TaxID=3071412 RepID=UPI0027E1AA9A|nr:S-layer homology domain-containing protein [Paenibacillus sp. LHD-117]MDQ6423284.1 S-layer homology domain-containing protein [Paenibacillus sp. LHD-117]